MPKTRVLPLLALTGLLACQPEPTTPPPDATGPEVGVEIPRAPSVDAHEMFASIEWLASDERQGRYTLDPEQIGAVADWISAQYEALGLEPVGGLASTRIAYSLRIGVERGETQRLVIEKKGQPIELAADEFTPRAEGVSGDAAGEVVFVGYGVRWSEPAPADDADASRIRAYDDLEGVDLQGKVALILAHGPNTPDRMALFAALQTLLEDFEVAAGPLREADATRKLEKLHQALRRDIVDLIAPFADTEQLGDEFWKVDDPKAPLDRNKLMGVLLSLAKGQPQFGFDTLGLGNKVAQLADAGAVGVIVVQGPRSFIGRGARDADALPGVIDDSGPHATGVHVLPDPARIPVVQLPWKRADKLFSIGGEKLSKVQAAIDGDYQPRSQALGVQATLHTELIDETLEAPNVLAQLPGKTDEVVLLGAHFDHIGTDELGSCRAIVRRETRDAVCNGADDNASGTAMLLELARVYVEAGIVPERTIVFAHFSGEELGLRGSRALIEDPPFDQAKVAAMVNLDMVGRLGPSGLAIGGIHSSADWMPLLDELGNYGMSILYEGGTTTRSDHAHWFRRQIPILFFFTGIHGDYHRAGDELDEINVEGLGTIGQMVSDLVWELAAGRTIAWSEGATISSGLPGTDPTTLIRRVDESGDEVRD